MGRGPEQDYSMFYSDNLKDWTLADPEVEVGDAYLGTWLDVNVSCISRRFYRATLNP